MGVTMTDAQQRARKIRKARGRRIQKRRIAVLHAAQKITDRQRVRRLAKIERRKLARVSDDS